MRRHRSSSVRVAALLALVVASIATTSATASAGTTETITLQDDNSFQINGVSGNPFCTTGDATCNLVAAKALGPNTIRIIIYWRLAAPANNSCTVPSVDLTDLNNYDSAYVARVTNEINNIASNGMGIELAFGGPFPCWASLHPDAAHCPNANACTDEPDPTLFADFVHAWAARFGFEVSRWSPYNEPDNATFLTPQTTSSNDSYTGLMYRALWFKARDEIRKFSTAPIRFGETANNGATSAGATLVTNFLGFAVCGSGTAEVSRDPAHYPSCTQVGPGPGADADVISFHFYGSSSLTPLSHLAALNTMSGILLNLQSRSLFPAGGFIAETEHGWRKDAGISASAQGVNNTCDEEAAYKNHQLIEYSNYEYQDSTAAPVTGFISAGLSGTLQPAYSNWRLALQVWRAVSTDPLDVWGILHAPGTGATSVTLNGSKNGTVMFTRTIPLASNRYFHTSISGAPGGLTWQATAGGLSSRVDTGTDCGATWNGGAPAH